MRILLVNKFYYPRGGDCIYTIELEKLLSSKGHEVAVFSMQHPSNIASDYSRYFPSHIDFNRRSLKSLVSLLVRPFGSSEVHRNFDRLLHDFKPDIVHLNNIHSQLSPIIALISRRNNIPVVWTLHDYKLVCPAYLFLSRGKPCEACLKCKFSVIRKRCIKNSIIASLIAYLEAWRWNPSKLSNNTDRFIAPSNFLKEKMVAGGFDHSKIEVIHNFTDESYREATTKVDRDNYCFVGRLSSEKGIETLLKAASFLDSYKLNIVGTGPLEEKLISENRNPHIEFLGYKANSELRSIISGSRFMVIPSEVYENNPLTVLEALRMGIPVLGSNMGGIPELIRPGYNGLMFEAGNVDDLQAKIKYLWEHFADFDRADIAADAHIQFNSDSYYNKLLHLYNDVLLGDNQSCLQADS